MSKQLLFGPCIIEDGRDDRAPHRFGICAPYKDGLSGTALLGSIAYLPHARVFAAAPELLASLEELLEPLLAASAALTERGLFPDEFAEAAFDRARAAIAKARGKSA